MKILVAVSGGVDSAVCALLLKNQGHEVSLVHFVMHKAGVKNLPDVRRVAEVLQLPLYEKFLEAEFEEKVTKFFISEYLSGRTPNPCVRCNPTFKFFQLLALGDELGCEKVATGHYAKVTVDAEGKPHLWEGDNPKKDQSYFLSGLSAEQLKRVVFPLAGYCKDETRRKACEAGIPVAQKKDSQEICFVPNDDYPAFLLQRAPEAFKPGPICDVTGTKTGEHAGLPYYTIGQRKGIGAHCARKYVVRLDAENNTVIIGDNSDLITSEVKLGNFHWINEKPEKSFWAKAKIRSTSPPKECEVILKKENTVLLRFKEPERAAAPGQAGVVYAAGEVLGAGTIEL